VRHYGRLNFTLLPRQNLLALVTLFLVTSCSLPEVNLVKTPPRIGNNNGVNYTDSSMTAGPKDRKSAMDKLDKTYLASVQVRYSEDSAPILVDFHRDRHNLVTFNLWRSEESISFVHLGYTGSEGVSAGLRFIWHFE